MSEVWRYFLLFIGAALVYNIVLIRFIGLCPFFGVSNSVDTSLGMSIAVIFVMSLATSVAWMAWNWILEPLGIGDFLYIPTFILIIASLVQFVEVVVKKVSQPLYRSMGIFLPLITTNCAVLATATETVKPGFFTQLNLAFNYTWTESIVYTLGAAVGFSVVLVVFAAIRERLEMAPVPKAFRGVPIAFITAALMSLSFMGFANLFDI